ncbi:hypothetical protein A3H65_04170 [Candidatus Giovannonibacteria bacterium RIFCSPLOWO2_02_FULL_45_14]|uniref:EamA domain-containing protein n=1 Tax=Candidatus Giovannonibacteria bacterium RIFCSPLOWO2_12_FULL_44_15 TaxID=1798364 RepID=A0A1F5XYJ2_9BACT|nr:MAG: hypothetical protein A3C75_03790 [Candidatus Giovannonibacteria bacterium RIFCSPHIGHO2_02_FULL_44_31]OGF77044.1 MAG: hypothetical protein A3E62_02395 [Candidatus Giovannonibacteria bacterium RIFCSPHIGHO2_12_FULL_44_29]OGF91257.1 MAG: hypothetical protein A3H65_04170 [Candidatus Giovannonibacteria bacterium RIFCSPLOWO2_02_FULL_45_14]OGF92995.1 MAG: hypothetical protein A3G54_01970 [Candidatus Giovannonibacteria bacterium RIFCSPLOWO2_12_FULL_44_15]
MAAWFFFALGAAIAQSCMNALSNRAVKLAQFSKITIGFVATGIVSLILLAVSYFLIGFPELGTDFWRAVLITGTLNTIMVPIGFKAYELGEFSSVYSMSLTAPIFVLFTAWMFLGESPPILGIAGVILSVVGLWNIARVSAKNTEAKDYKKGNLLGLSVALMASVSSNFDKLAILNSDRFFSSGIITGFMTIAYAIYLLIKYKKLIVRGETLSYAASPIGGAFLLHGVMLLSLIGIIHALNAYFYNSALVTGLVSYTIAIKRVGVLFGVLWGWLFFREKNISKKLLGAAIAILGVLLILLA